MHFKNLSFSSFSRAFTSRSDCYRLDGDSQKDLPVKNLLARGAGLSYSDCCTNDQGIILDSSRLNHFLSFDAASGILICQPSVTFAELFLVHEEFIPPVIPGTLHATLAGGIANDVHGKSNVHQGTLGHHILWFDLQIGHDIFHCSREENSELFFATIGGLGLTGFIRRIAIKMHQASRFVKLSTEKFTSLDALLQTMQRQAGEKDHQAAWLDLLNRPKALLYSANHCEAQSTVPTPQIRQIPTLPSRLLSRWNLRAYNHYHFHRANQEQRIDSLVHFNNPLDRFRGWNHLYGRRGLLQFQAVFELGETVNQLLTIIQNTQATASLAVVKYFSRSGPGLLSFVQPGFTVAIDFINNAAAQKAIRTMNALITELGGKVYLAKDLCLTQPQLQEQYPEAKAFRAVLKRYASPMRSDLGRRLGLEP